MTAPVDDDRKDDPPELPVPPWLLRPRAARLPPISSAAPPGGDRRPLRSEPFPPDNAPRDRRSAFAMAPQPMPAPPVVERKLWRPVTGVVAAAAVAATCAYAVIRVTGDRPAVEQASARAALPSRAATAKPMPAAAPRLVSTELRQHMANEAAVLPVKLGGGLVDGALVVIAGLPPGTLVSVGTPAEPDRWHVPTAEAEVAEILPPADFAGVMDLTIDLVLPDGQVVDRRTARLDWIASPLAAVAPSEVQSAPPSQPMGAAPLPAEEIAALVARGRAFLGSGDIASARLMLRRAAEAGDAAAALMLGSTFDPNMLGRLAAVGVAPDRAQAVHWYQHAASLGSAEARSRLGALPPR